MMADVLSLDEHGMAMVMQAYDSYKAGLVKTRERDLETEAMILSRMGSVMYRVRCAHAVPAVPVL